LRGGRAEGRSTKKRCQESFETHDALAKWTHTELSIFLIVPCCVDRLKKKNDPPRWLIVIPRSRRHHTGSSLFIWRASSYSLKSSRSSVRFCWMLLILKAAQVYADDSSRNVLLPLAICASCSRTLTSLPAPFSITWNAGIVVLGHRLPSANQQTEKFALHNLGPNHRLRLFAQCTFRYCEP